MGAQIKIILIIVAILAVLGAAGAGLHYGTQGIEDTETAAQSDGEKLAAVPPAEDEAAETAEAPAGKAMPPILDIVRVEPSGDLVAAGRAASNALVTLYLGDEELDKAEANSIGEWAMVLSEPLAPGSYDLSLRATGPDGKGEPVEGDRVTVVIEGSGKTPLVALARPGEPTEVVQQPVEETVVASADSAPDAAPDASAEASSAAPSAEASGQSAESQNDAAADSDTDSNTSAASAPVQSGSAQADVTPSQTDQSDATLPQTGASETATAAADDAPAEEQQASMPSGSEQQGSAQEGAEPTGSVAASETTVAAASTEPPASQSQAGTPESSGDQPTERPAQQPVGQPTGKVTIETVEVEDPGRLMLSGEAEPGDAVRLYLNNERLDDVKTGADGRWTLSSERPMPPGRYELRADVVEETGKVKARAEVKFDRVQMVASDDAAPSTGADAPAPTAGSGDVDVQTTSQPGSTVTIVSHAGGSGTASAGSAVGEGAGTSVVVIARGDNLWRIARKIYGKGVRHSVIFEANKNQIGNPHLIYPGQVFTIPVLEGENG